MKDYVILVDENNNPLGTMDKYEAHNANTPLHRAFSVFLFNGKKQLLLQQRNKNKKTWGGIWSNSCCGHQKLDEILLKTVSQRIDYELGIKHAKLTMILPNYRYRVEKDGIVENEICPVFAGFTSDSPVPYPIEVEAIRWISWEQWILEVTKRPSFYTPWCVEETNLLAENKKFKHFLKSL